MKPIHPLAWPIRTHLLVIVVLLTACMIGWTVSIGGTVKQLTLARASDAIEARSAKIAERYLAISRETEQVLTALSFSEEVLAGDYRAMTARLEKIHAAMPHYATMVAASPDGYVRACSIAAELPIDVRQRQWFQRVMASRVFVVDEFIISKSAGSASLPYALPVLDRAGEVRLILGAALKLSFFEELFAGIAGPAIRDTYLLDHDLRVLYASTGPESLGRPGTDYLPFGLTLSQPGAHEFAAAGSAGERTVFVVAPIIVGQEESRFTLVVGLSHRELYGSASRQMLINLLVLGGGAVAFALLFLCYGRKALSDPLQRLLATTREVSRGNLAVRTGLAYDSPEFGVLAREIDGMIAALAADVLHRREQEMALRESQARFQALVENAADAIYLADVGGRLLDVNAEAERQTGYSRAELLAMKIADVDARAHGEGAAFAGFIEELARVGKTTLETAHRRKDGTVFPVEVRVVYLPTANAPMVLGVARDITARRRAEEEQARLEAQLQQAHKLEVVGQLAGGVAHDFNNMLGVILGHCEMALEGVDRQSPLYADLRAISQAAERSAEITRQLLAFARKQAIAPRVLDLNATVEGMLKMLRRLIGEHIALQWQPGAGLWPVRLDPSQVDQLLANLCINARAAIAGSGTIVVATENREIGEECILSHGKPPAGEYVCLSVGDDGCGMDRETLHHIFEPFFTTKEVGEGTGLGLAMVFGIVQQNGGAIDVDSVPGRGTTFSVFLPRHGAEGLGEEKTSAPAPARGRQETILLVEDEGTILKMAVAMLGLLGYRVLAAQTPDQARRVAEDYTETIDLLMTDVVMPQMNGRDLAEKLLRLHPEMKCLFMSGYTANVISDHGVIEGGRNFIQKPFSKVELAAAIRAVLEAQPTRDEGEEAFPSLHDHPSPRP